MKKSTILAITKLYKMALLFSDVPVTGCQNKNQVKKLRLKLLQGNGYDYQF